MGSTNFRISSFVFELQKEIDIKLHTIHYEYTGV